MIQDSGWGFPEGQKKENHPPTNGRHQPEPVPRVNGGGEGVAVAYRGTAGSYPSTQHQGDAVSTLQ